MTWRIWWRQRRIDSPHQLYRCFYFVGPASAADWAARLGAPWRATRRMASASSSIRSSVNENRAAMWLCEGSASRATSSVAMSTRMTSKGVIAFASRQRPSHTSQQPPRSEFRNILGRSIGPEVGLPQARRALKRPIGWLDGVATDRVIHSAPFRQKHKLLRGGMRNVTAWARSSRWRPDLIRRSRRPPCRSPWPTSGRVGDGSGPDSFREPLPRCQATAARGALACLMTASIA